MASITLLRGLAGSSGVPEVSSGIPSPPRSPPLAARHASAAKQSISDFTNRGGQARRGGAAYTITEECERLFCETLRAVFLVGRTLARQDSLVMGMQNHSTADISNNIFDMERTDRRQDYPSPEMDDVIEHGGLVKDWVEIYDYVGGNKFRGFVAEKDGEKAMFVFFDQSVIGGDLKPGLMALLELCDMPHFSCSRLTVCLDRLTEPRAMEALMKDLGWIGFQLATLNNWTSGDEITSDRWFFMDMDV